jgi:hypothetical protein
MSTKITPRVEMDFGAGWVDVSEDVVSQITASWGIHGSSPKQRVADPGSMRFRLDNSTLNSGGLLGYYSPGHPNVRAGFDIRTPVRYVLNHEFFGDKVKWVGTVESVKPVAGLTQVVDVSCADWLEDAARSKLTAMEVQTDIQSDILFDTLIAAAPKQPPNGTMVGTGSDIYAYALDDVQDERTTLLEVLQRLMLSEFGICHESAGQVVFEGRKLRGGGGAIKFALSEDDQIIGLGLASGRDDIINRVQVIVHPRRRDGAATTVLFNLASAVEIPRGTSITINCPYRDPNQQAQRVGGVDMVTPVAVTDYSFNASKDGSGADYTGQLSVSYVGTPGGNSATVIATNAGPADGWIPANGLKLRGRGLYNFESVIADYGDAASIAAFGEGVLSYDMPFQDSTANAADLALFLLALNKDPRPRAQKVTFLANWSEVEIEQAFNLEISDRVSVTSPGAGLTAEPYFVNGFSFVSQLNGLTTVTMDLAPVNQAQYWQLEVTGRTELDETTVLGYGLFAVGWILDSSTLGTDTFLN